MELELKRFLDSKAYKIRKHIIETCINYGEGHAGPSLSSADIMAVLYFSILNVDVLNPKDKNRDYFILSAGHKCLALYATLVEKGFEEVDVLHTYNQLGTLVPGHPDATKFRGIDFSTGSLGHGLPLACGVSKGLKIMGMKNRVFVLMGDGEQGEGSVWEAAGFAAHHKLDNIIAIIDRNHLQINGRTEEVLSTDSLEERYKAFGWHVIIANGHDVENLYDSFDEAFSCKGKPTIIIANTIKGKGLSFAENNVSYHHWHPKEESEINQALNDLKLLQERYEYV